MLSTTNKPSNVNSSCEQCGGQMKITTTDRHNKIMECLYCGHIVDVPDKINTNDYAEFFANVSGNRSISPTITLHSNNLISLGSHDIFKNDIFDGAFSNLSHQSFFTNSNIPEDVQSVFRELLSDQSFNELGGVSRTYTRGNSSFVISTEGVSNKSISASYSSNTNIHSVMSTEVASSSSSASSNIWAWLFIGIFLILIFIGIYSVNA